MKVPLSWLKDYVEVDVDVKTLAERLTFAGIEVESIDVNGNVPKYIIVGEITSVEQHVNSTQLYVCLVNNGKKVIRVVSGAKNCRAGDRVPLAVAGATLPDGMIINETKIQGVLSQGMLCAEDELGLSDDHSGIMVLPREAQLGRPIAEVLGPPEHVLSLEITPNRPDLLGIIGIAREVAALFGKKLKLPPAELKECSAPLRGAVAAHSAALQQDTITTTEALRAIKDVASVVVEDSIGCPRYIARLLTGVSVAPSPFWLRRRLALAGIGSINNIVDITNYVLLECGQPLHAFDLSLIKDNKIIVRHAQAGETILTLDGVKRKLNHEMLVIADAVHPVAVAGVMGGVETGIQPTTTSVLLESACFNPALVRRTSKSLELTSESSYRFERGVDINGVDFASRRACV